MITVKDNLTKDEMEEALMAYYYFFCRLYGLSWVAMLPSKIEFDMHPKKWVNRHDKNLTAAIEAVQQINTRPEIKAVVIQNEQGKIDALARIRIDSEYLVLPDGNYADINPNRSISIGDIVYGDINREKRLNCAREIIETVESLGATLDGQITNISLEILKNDEDMWMIAHELGFLTTDELTKESRRFHTILLEKDMTPKKEAEMARKRQKEVN